MTEDVVDLRRRISRPVEDRPCACTPDHCCLFHYDQLDPVRRARERVRAGVDTRYGGGWR
jgi:hypothetical protein